MPNIDELVMFNLTCCFIDVDPELSQNKKNRRLSNVCQPEWSGLAECHQGSWASHAIELLPSSQALPPFEHVSNARLQHYSRFASSSYSVPKFTRSWQVAVTSRGTCASVPSPSVKHPTGGCRLYEE